MDVVTAIGTSYKLLNVRLKLIHIAWISENGNNNRWDRPKVDITIVNSGELEVERKVSEDDQQAPLLAKVDV